MSDNEETPKDVPSTSEDNTEQTKDQNTTSEGDAAPSASSGVVEVAEEKASDDYIRLRVITSDMTNEVHFRVKSATSLGRLKRSYCSKMGFQVEELRFVFDGHRITDDDTPKSLGMINDDVIEIYQERTGGV
ncbi:small ubiquitin-related modifier-like [Daktulosphaira vitifoliae]|uniref:small ubiquitin-related modifier-like n=1 Tax=Daktulosphaira vitifoliae TaxID=58002 RepID=UPI0021AAE920|nr:small ubiquitin-related modifier-like [Daktulosphaira vitifoliae]